MKYLCLSTCVVPSQIMGHMDVISIVSDGFNIYFPIAIVVLCFATYFRLGSRFLHLVGFQQFVGDDDMTLELTQEGRSLMKRGEISQTLTIYGFNAVI